jgi:hypothetical protein
MPKYYLGILFILLVQSLAKAQDSVFFPKIVPDQLTVDDGLSHAISGYQFQDSQGFMWIPCFDALNRFDGKNVKVYNLQRYFKNCLPLQQGFGFTEDEYQNIYIGSVQGLFRYDRKSDKFTLLKQSNSKYEIGLYPIGYSHNKVWCFTRKWQIFSFNTITQKLRFEIQLNLPECANPNFYANSNFPWVHFPFIDKREHIWCISSEQAVRLNSRNLDTARVLWNGKVQHNELKEFCSYSKSNDKLILLSDSCLYTRVMVNGILQQHTALSGIPLGKVTRFISNNDYLFIMNSDLLCFLIDLRTMKITNQYSMEESVGLCFLDELNRVWVYKNAKGLFVYNFNKSPFQILPYCRSFGTLGRHQVLFYDEVLNTQTMSYTKRKPFFSTFHEYRMLSVPSQGIWVYLENPSGKEPLIQLYNERRELKIEIPSQVMPKDQLLKELYCFEDNKLLALLSNGIHWFNWKEKEFIRISNITTKSPFHANRLSGNRVAIGYVGSDMKIIKRTGQNSLVEIKNILPGVPAYYMAEDSARHKYWVGSTVGIYVLDSVFRTIRYISTEDGLAGNYIYGLLIDEEGNAYCSHQKGLSYINTQTYEITNYDKHDGIQGWDFLNRAYVKTPEGVMIFGGMEATNVFKPPLQRKRNYVPEVYVDEININQTIYLPDTNANLIDHLKLQFFQNSITVKALIKDLEHARSHRLIYRLMPNDSTWKYSSGNEAIQFNILSSGTYELELGVFDKFHPEKKCSKRILITIGTVFYKTFWFWIIVLLVAQSVAGWLLHKRAQRRHKQNVTHELNSLKLAGLEQQAFTSLLNPHFIFNILNSAQHFININARQSG